MNRVIREINSILNAKRMILDYPELKTEKKKVNLHYYHAEFASGGGTSTSRNLGDCLSKVVVDYMLKRKDLSLEDSVSKTEHLYAIGCILLMGYQNATIWGSSFPFEPGFLRGLLHRFRKLDVRCVRGPMTRDTFLRLGFKCPEIYGDPAVLMPLIYNPEYQKRKQFSIIPHYTQKEKVPEKYKDAIIDMETDDYKSVIDEICASEFVISSSLHGIILAEAYGIPAVFYVDRSEQFNYKYEDYYKSTNRKFKYFGDIETAIHSEKQDAPDLDVMQNNLINTFPYDLWN